MDIGFQTTLKKNRTRDRFYSSMNHDEYFELYGPPAPIFKPMNSPFNDIPELTLEGGSGSEDNGELPSQVALQHYKIEEILEIEGSQNHTEIFNKQENSNFNNSKKNQLLQIEQLSMKRPNRNRSQSDNSEYLIFNFLDRTNQNGKKKRKLE